MSATKGKAATGKGAKNPPKAPKAKNNVRIQDTRFRDHLRMVMDPCQSELAPSVYGGVPGKIDRFTSCGQIALGTDTAVMFGWVPGAYRTVFAQAALGSTSVVPTYSFAVPGGSYLSGISSAARVIGACMQLHYNGTEQNRGGSVALGTAQASEISGGTATTVDSVYTTLQTRCRTPPGEMECIWNPAIEDESYSPATASVTVDSFNDRTGIYFVYEGPSGATFAWTLTVIYEWIPLRTSEQMMPPTIKSTILDPIGQISNFLSKMGFHSSNLGTGAEAFAKATRALFSTTGGWRYATRNQPLLTMGAQGF